MVKKLKLNSIRNKLKEEGLPLFTPFDLEKYFNASPNTVSLFLNRNVEQGYIIKLKNQLYAFADEQINEMLIANRVYQPSYVSFEYALMFYNIIPETVYTITSATTKTTREFVIKNITYLYHHLKRRAFTGYIKRYFNGEMVLIAEPEKALADYLYFVSLGKSTLNSRLNLEEIKQNKLLDYVRLFQKEKLLNLVKQIYD